MRLHSFPTRRSTDLLQRLHEKNGITAVVPSEDDAPGVFAVIVSWIPVAVIVAGFCYLIARLRTVSAALERIETKLGARGRENENGEPDSR